MAQAASTYLGEQRRRSARIEQTSAVIIRGVDLLGQPFEERAAAQDLSFHGCRYASKHHLPKNTWITLEVPSGGSSEEAACVRARVAWIQRPRTLRDLFQVGVELERGRNIWGVAPSPADWSNGAVITTAREHLEHTLQTQQANDGSKEETEASLEAYLQMAFAHTNKDFAAAIESDEGRLLEEEIVLGQLREQFVAASKRMIDEARAAADEAAKKAAGEVCCVLESEQRVRAEVFHQKWIEALEHGKVDAKEEIESAVTQDLAIRLASFEEQVRGTLIGEWTEKMTHLQEERSRWEAEMQALRQELRASEEENEKRSEQRLAEKLREIRSEWESSGIVSTNESSATAVKTEGISDSIRKQLREETDTARAQWHDLLESSLDSAARRLNERLTSSSQEVVHRTEQEVAVKIEDLQKESGLAAEAGRASLIELRSALEEELSKAKAALDGIEQSAGRFSEYSRQLEAASQDSVNELRQRLESSVARHSADLDRRAAEAEKTFGERAAQMLEQMSRESVAKGVEQIGRAVAAGLANATKATEELATREEQAEGILRIHRERLRQASEQAQRDGTANLASQVERAQRDLQEIEARSLAQWKTELAEEQARSAEEASAALTKGTEQKLAEANSELVAQSQQAIGSAQEKLEKEVCLIEAGFGVKLGEIETNHIVAARERLALEAHERLESAKNEFARAAEMAGSAFGEAIEEGAENALESFSAVSKAKTDEGRAQLATAGDNVLAEIQSHAQSSFEHFQEQMAIKSEQALQRTSETLGHQLESTLERFRMQAESRLEEWSAKQDSMSAEAIAKNGVQLQAAASSWVEMTLERLDSRSEERVDSAVRATENAIREACVDIFENIAQMIKKQLQGTLEIRSTVSGNEINQQEHRASA